MTTKRFVVYSGINLLLAIAALRVMAPVDGLLAVGLITAANAIGWLEGRVQYRAEK